MAGDTRAIRILVVDDEADTRMAMALLLRDMGHEVQTAANGVEALQRAKAMRPQLVLLDIGMPQLDGWQVAPLLREALGRSAVLVAVSGRGDAESAIRSRKAGFDAHVAKPIDLALLNSILQQAQSG